MADDIKVSVIVPVYNSAPYLRQCLDSIVGQTLREIEIICVDDGSTDESPAILDEYAAADARLSVLHQQNQYAGVARNNGMAHARGKYLVFWDSDDYFDLTALEKMYNQCEADEADICVCGGKRFYEESGREVVTNAYLKANRIPDVLPFNRKSNPDNILRFTETATWNKMYRRSFVEAKNIDFKPLRNGNDVFFSILALCEAEKITVVDEHLVCYRKGRSDSLINTLSKAPLVLPQAWEEVRGELLARGILPKKSFDNRVVSIVMHAFVQIGDWEGYLGCFNYLRSEGLKSLGLQMQPEGYYDPPVATFLEHLFSDEPGEFLLYLFHNDHAKLVEKSDILSERRMELKRAKREAKACRKAVKEKEAQIESLRLSASFRVGAALTKPFRAIRLCCQRGRS